MDEVRPSYGMRLLIAFDQAANVLLCDGMPDETISARAWREKNQSLIKWLDRLFWWQKDHCKQCYDWEQQRKDLPPEYAKACDEIRQGPLPH